MFACSEIDKKLVIDDLFDRCPRIERRRTSQQPMTRQATVCMFVGSFCQIERSRKAEERITLGADHLLMSFDSDVVSLVYRPELVESVNPSECTRGPWACHGTVLFLESEDHGRLEKFFWTKSREKNAQFSLDICLFVDGERGDKKKLLKAAPSMAEVSFTRSPIIDHDEKKDSRFVPCSLDESHHHKDSMTDLTRPGSLPCEELQSSPSSKRLEKAKFVLRRKSGKIS